MHLLLVAANKNELEKCWTNMENAQMVGEPLQTVAAQCEEAMSHTTRRGAMQVMSDGECVAFVFFCAIITRSSFDLSCPNF